VWTYRSKGGQTKRLGLPPFFTPAEEGLLTKYVRVQAMIGMSLTPLASRRKCVEYIGTLSAACCAAAADYFGGTITPGTLEMSRAINSRPEVVARWFAALSLPYRHELIFVGRQIWNMDETAVKAKDIILHARETIIGGKGLRKPEVVVPDIGSGAEGCIAAFTISAAGDTASPFFVDGGKEGHAFVRATPANGSSATSIPLSSQLQEGATVVQRTPAVSDKNFFDLFAAHFASFASNFYPTESKVLALDGAKFHLSPKGLTLLWDAGVHVIVVPFKMSYLLQALDSPSAFGRFQPGRRGSVLARSHSFVAARRPFDIVDLVDCVRMAADAALTRDALVSAFKRVGMWSPTLTLLLLPIVRKELKESTVVNGTLSTAGPATLLTAPKIISALESLEAERVAKAAEAAEAKEEREKRTAERAVEKEAERLAVAGRKAAAAEKRATKEMAACRKAWNRRWAAVTAEFLEEAAARNRRLSPNGYK